MFLRFAASAIAIAAFSGCASNAIPENVRFVNEASLLTRAVTGARLLSEDACKNGRLENQDVHASADSTSTGTGRRKESLVIVTGGKKQVCADGPSTQ